MNIRVTGIKEGIMIDELIRKGKTPVLLFLNELPRDSAPGHHNIVKVVFWFLVWLTLMPIVFALEWLKYGTKKERSTHKANR